MATTGVYNIYKAAAETGSIAYLTDTIRVLLVDNTYTFDPDDAFVADVSASELAGVGYVRKTLAGKTITQDDVNDLAFIDATDVAWTGANFGTPDGAIIYQFNTNDADSVLICCVNLNPHTLTNGGDYTVQWAAGGILKGT